MQTETQKNWNNFFENKKPRKHPKIRLFVIVFILSITIASTIYITKDYDTQNTIISNVYTPESKSMITNTMFTSDRNGILMKTSINTLLDYMEISARETNTEVLNSYIKDISSLSLSSEYDTLKSQAIQKLEYLISYRNTTNIEDLDKYHSIDIMYEITKAFNEADVKYEVINDRIKYWYYTN